MQSRHSILEKAMGASLVGVLERKIQYKIPASISLSALVFGIVQVTESMIGVPSSGRTASLRVKPAVLWSVWLHGY